MKAWFRAVVHALAVVYLASMWLDGVGCNLPARLLPHAADYFVEVAALFPDAATSAAESRAEAWECAAGRWAEIDTRPYFPLDPDDKENRFQRALHFFRDEPAVLRSLDAYLVLRHNRLHGAPAGVDDSIPEDASIGGIRILVARTKLPKPGDEVDRFTRRPLADFAKDERHVVYRTPAGDIQARCADAPPRDRAP